MRSYLFILLTGIAIISKGQSNLSFYQMQGATPQNMNYNPAVFPKAKAFLSLPGISGIDLSVNNSFGIGDILTPTGDSTLIDIDKFLLTQKEGSYVNIGAGITDLMVGSRIGEKTFVSVFANEKIDGTLFYPVSLLNFLWKGNRSYVGQEYKVNDIAYNFTYYREYGVGVGRSIDFLGFKTDLGVRVKYLNGIFHSSIKDNLEISVYTDSNDYSMRVSLNDGLIRTVGVGAIEDENYTYMVTNKNSGLGLDLGIQTAISDRLTVGLSALDIGYISWSEYAETASFSGTSFSINGAAFDNMDQLATTVTDSIDALEIDTVATKFTTSLNSSTFFHGAYRLTENGYVQATLTNYFTQGQVKSGFGIGYLQNLGEWLAASVTVVTSSQQGANIGAGLMLRGGPLQMYISADNILNTINVPQATGLNLKFGINFLFGKPHVESSSESEN